MYLYLFMHIINVNVNVLKKNLYSYLSLFFPLQILYKHAPLLLDLALEY